MLEKLKDGNFKETAQMLLVVFKDLKLVMTVVSFFMIIYMIGYDTVFVPMSKEIEKRDHAIAQQREKINSRKQQNSQEMQLQKQLSGMTKQLIKVKAGESARVVAIKESGTVVDVAKGGKRILEEENPLPPPHDKLENVIIDAKDNTVVNVLVPPSGEKAQEGEGEKLLLEKHDYEIKMTGTYPALVDFLNQITAWDNLVMISQVRMVRLEKPDEPQPDPETEPLYPVKVEMTVLFSLYMYSTNGSTSST